MKTFPLPDADDTVWLCEALGCNRYFANEPAMLDHDRRVHGGKGTFGVAMWHLRATAERAKAP